MDMKEADDPVVCRGTDRGEAKVDVARTEISVGDGRSKRIAGTNGSISGPTLAHVRQVRAVVGRIEAGIEIRERNDPIPRREPPLAAASPNNRENPSSMCVCHNA